MVNGRNKTLTSNVRGGNKGLLESVLSLAVIEGLQIGDEGIVHSAMEDHVSEEKVV
jgi:hypothetical protein